MAVISTNNIVLGLIKGSVWGTEVHITGSSATFLYASSLSVSGQFEDFLPRDVGQGGKRKAQARLAENVTGTITCDTTYGQGWLTLLTAIMGTESAPAETTVGQADYTDNIDLADSVLGVFYTLAWSIETDRALVIPSIKITSFQFAMDINGAGTVTFQFIGDTLLESSTTSVTDISGLTKLTYETATLGGTAHYFRINGQGGAGLASGDNKAISGFTISLQRPAQTRFGLRGASTKYTEEPIQLGPLDGTLNVKFTEVDNATFDMWSDWFNSTAKKAEIFFDGSQIAAGVNRSLKFQFPYLQATGTMPTGHDFANNNSLMLPTLTYRMLQASAAPTGMSGVTDLMRVVPIWQTQSTKWSR